MRSPDRLRRSFAALIGLEVRTVGAALFREGAVVTGAFAAFCILTTVTARRYGEHLDAIPEILLTTLPVALILPWAVWKGDPVFGRALLWTLPVRRQQAAAAKIVAGALWLLLAVLVVLVSLALMARATGGRVGIDEVRLVGPASAGLAAAARVRWVTPLWMWLMPFGSALLVYLASSAAWIGLRHPVRWLAGVAILATLVIVLGVNLGPGSALYESLGRLFDTVVNGRWGFDLALTGGLSSLSEEIDTPGPGSANLWSALPTLGGWAAALLVWLGGTLLALALALRRHWER
jgi:hypothetical protein